MSVFFDTNVYVAAVTNDTDRSDDAIRALNRFSTAYTSVLNVMELRSVLSKKKVFDRDHIERIERRIAEKTVVVFPDASEIVAANRLQAETLLYPMDALILATAKSTEADLVSFDAELRAHGAQEPVELLEGDR